MVLIVPASGGAHSGLCFPECAATRTLNARERPRKNILDGATQPDQTGGEISEETGLWTILPQRSERMSVEKTIEELLRGESDANIRFNELCHLLEAKGFRIRTQGSRQPPHFHTLRRARAD